VDSDPLKLDPVRNTWLKKKTFPNAKFRLQIHDRHLLVKHDGKTLHRFLQPMLQLDDASPVFFHLFIQDANKAASQQTPVKTANPASAQNIFGEIPSIVISTSEESSNSAIMAALRKASALMKNTMLNTYSASEGLCKNIIAKVSRQTRAAFEQGHDGRISSLSILPDGRYIVTCGLDDGRAPLWNVASGKMVCDLAKKHDKTDPYMGPGVHYMPYRVWMGATVKVRMTFKKFADEPPDLEEDQHARQCSVAVLVYDESEDEERPFEFEVAWTDLLKMSTDESRDMLQEEIELADTEIQVHGTIEGMDKETENRALGTLHTFCLEHHPYFVIKVGSQTLQIKAGTLKETDVKTPGFNCSDVWCVQDVGLRYMVALGRRDNWIIVVDMANRTGQGLLCTHAFMVRHEGQGLNGERPKSRTGVRVVKYNAQINKLLTCGGGVVRMWDLVKRNQGQLEEMQQQEFRRTALVLQKWKEKLKNENQEHLKQRQSEQRLSEFLESEPRQSSRKLPRTSTKANLSTEATSEWMCMEIDPEKPFFEVSLGEDIIDMHMLGGDTAMEDGVQHDPRKLLLLAVAATGRSASRVYIIDGYGDKKCTVSVPMEEGALTTVSMTQIAQNVYLIAGTKSGNVLLIKICDDSDEINLSCYSDWRRLTGHARSISIWTCTVVRYKFVAGGNLHRCLVLITTSGDNNIKLWSCDNPLEERCKCLLTLSHHTGPVTALGVKEGIDTQGMENEISMIDAAELQIVDIYTASWDGKCMRWVLADLLGKQAPDSAVALYSEPTADDGTSMFRQLCHCFIDLVSDTKRLAIMPQQVYRSITLFEAIASPMSWCIALLQLSMTSLFVKRAPWNKGEEQDGFFLGSGGGILKVPFWFEYFLVTLMAWPYVLVLLFDHHNTVKQQIFELVGADDAGSNWRTQKKVASLRSLFEKVSFFLWFWSQMLWMMLFKYMVMTFDCSHLSIVNSSPSWQKEVDRMYNYKGDAVVMDEDRGVQCFEGWHLALSVYGFVLMWLYVFLSIPLLVGLGDCNLVVSVPWYVRCSPLALIRTIQFRTQRKQWPKYAGLFTRCNNYYLFEACLTMSKVIIPSVIVITTYTTARRDLMIQAMGIALVFFACHTPPVQARMPAGGIMLLSFVLFLIPSLKLYLHEKHEKQHCFAMLANQTLHDG